MKALSIGLGMLGGVFLLALGIVIGRAELGQCKKDLGAATMHATFSAVAAYPGTASPVPDPKCPPPEPLPADVVSCRAALKEEVQRSATAWQQVGEEKLRCWEDREVAMACRVAKDAGGGR